MSHSLWFKDAIVYQLHVKAFHDSNCDGIGDFQGLTRKLDYLADLGVTAIWLLPFYPSPLKDDGYDIAGYTDVHPAYGTLRDFKTLLREAHERDLKVITELVINHTSDQHPWFQRARQAKPRSRARNFYVWSDTPDRYEDARIIFKDFEHSNWAWDAEAAAYYWHRFYSHQPDLNFDNPAVRKAIFRVLDFWLEMGVDGMRLDAVPYLYERDGTSCENLPETHAFLKELRRHVDEHYRDRMLLAEANQWPEDSVQYFGDGDECHMAFHFPVMPRLFMAVHMEDRFPIVDILQQTPEIPETSQWAIFLRNHDELTLEMVTDEDRDYMYRVYAHDPQARINLGIRRRLAPLMGQNRRKIELMNSLLMSLPGTPVVYYGDEIGMGDNIYMGDRNGVRTPMQWSADRNAGFSDANPQQLFLPVIIDPNFHYWSVNVEAQQGNPHSLLWWTKRLLAVRKRHRAFSRGSIEFLHPENRKVLVFLRHWQDEHILVVVNLSRFVQAVELKLSRYRDMVPVEVFGRTPFPRIGDLPYFLTLGPHTFYWFILGPAESAAKQMTITEIELPSVAVNGSWEAVLQDDRTISELERLLPYHLRARRWFAAKTRQILSTELLEAIPIGYNDTTVINTLFKVAYSEGDPEVYQLALGFATGQRADELIDHQRQVVVARLNVASAHGRCEGVLYDAAVDPEYSEALLDVITHRRRRSGTTGVLRVSRTRAFKQLRGEGKLRPWLLGAEQSNTSIVFGDRLILKLFRKIDRGTNPEMEIGRFLTERTSFDNMPPLAAAIEYQPGSGPALTLAVLQGFVPNEGDAWSYTLDALNGYFERVLTRPAEERTLDVPSSRPLALLHEHTPTLAAEVIGGYLAFARLLGQRTAEMHLGLASRSDDPDFAPEPINSMYRRSLYQSTRTRADQVFELLRQRFDALPERARPLATAVLAMKDEIELHLHAVVERKISGLRIRCHGDYHLGQVLFTGKDFVIMDFEGEPARPISERRLKRSPLRDVGGMIRSFHYASVMALSGGSVRTEDQAVLEPWAEYWYVWVVVEFLRAYLAEVADSRLVPEDWDHVTALLDLCVLDKALYELAYELNNRPTWVETPLRGISDILQTEPGA